VTDKSQKTEKPTPKKLREAKREGNVPRSSDVSSWLTVLGFSFVVPFAIRSLTSLFARLVDALLEVIAHPDPGAALHVLQLAGRGALLVLAPVLLASVVLAIGGGAVQGGLRIAPKRFAPKFDKLNVAKGIKHMLGAQAAWGLAKTLLKFGAFSAVTYAVLRSAGTRFAGSGAWSLSAAVGSTGDSALRLVRLVAVIGLAIAGVDYVVERRRIGKSLMMSPDEVKRENRQTEGDPHQKGAIRQRQREVSRNRMMADVARADVVIVNPTHVAVALVYEQGQGAPRVVARGAGAIAAKIREEAEKHRRPMVQDIPLARTLYAACEVGDAIPVELYDAVARVLAFVMALRRKGTLVGTYRPPALQPALR
jgi:flagellar biosynthetic protein FlhB